MWNHASSLTLTLHSPIVLSPISLCIMAYHGWLTPDVHVSWYDICGMPTCPKPFHISSSSSNFFLNSFPFIKFSYFILHYNDNKIIEICFWWITKNILCMIIHTCVNAWILCQTLIILILLYIFTNNYIL